MYVYIYIPYMYHIYTIYVYIPYMYRQIPLHTHDYLNSRT